MFKLSSNQKTFFFVVIICGICALILSVLSLSLQSLQEKAKKLDQSKQLLIAAKVLSYDGFFLTKESSYVHAKWDAQKQTLVADPSAPKASEDAILSLYQSLVIAKLTNDQGEVFSFEEANLNLDTYLAQNKKSGYAKLPYKLVYYIYQTPNTPIPEAYVFPVNGFGLWDAIYGYIALENNADIVIGTTWYDQAETAGLGADITLPSWQNQFEGKHIFQESSEGTTNFERAPIGIQVVKGKVSEIYPNSPKAMSAVDGITGASETGKGVTNAYRQSLEPYRPFLIQARERMGS